MKVKLKKKLRSILNKGVLRKYYELASEIKKNKNKKLSDKEYIIKRAEESTGITLNINNPKMLIEKVLWLKYHYKNPLMTICTDKYEVKKFVEEKGYSNIIMKNYGVFEKFEDIDFSILPKKVFIKSTHTSGVNQVFEQKKTNYNRTKKRFNKSLNTNYFYKSREWNYKNIEPRLLVEPYLDMDKYLDYKFFALNGKIEYFAIVKDINDKKGLQSTNTKFNLYYPNLKPFDGDVGRPKFDDTQFTFSEYINTMIKISEDLASHFVYCRVDFLVSDDEVIFGEITFYPNGGAMLLKPLHLEYYYGRKLSLDKIDTNYLF